jgi:hypothetical protein
MIIHPDSSNGPEVILLILAKLKVSFRLFIIRGSTVSLESSRVNETSY